MTAALAGMVGLAAGGHTLFGYNRANYLYDRKMRLEQEFKVIEFRNLQASLWREDVRDIIGLTERRMDSYLVVNTLQLGMCVGLFTEGRLEPGTPPWLLHLYMLTLGAAFMYLLMSVWLALHAAVVAQSSSVRLLTQFVRLPIPTWEQLEAARTYGSNFEELGVKHMLRVPFVGAKEGAREAHVRNVQEELRPGRRPSETSLASSAAAMPSVQESEAAAPERGGQAPPTVDPWQLEGHTSDIYELLRNPTQLCHHVQLARQATKYYQCYDAFARVSMAFGTNQLLHAITYYAIGYCSVMDRAPWPAWCVGTIMCGIAAALVELDFVITKLDRLVAQALIFLGPICASVAACAWTRRLAAAQTIVLYALPVAYATHGIWLFVALRACSVERQPNGSFLPMKFRPVLYLDIFGWLSRSGSATRTGDSKAATSDSGVYQALREETEEWAKADPSDDRSCSRISSFASESQRSEASHRTVTSERLAEMRQALDSDIALWNSEGVRTVIEESDRSRIDKLAERFDQARSDDVKGARPAKSGAAADFARGVSEAEPEPESSKGGQQSERWVNIRGFSDYGQEMRYLYNPATTEVHHVAGAAAALGGAASSSSAGASAGAGAGDAGLGARTLTETEEELEQFCAAADKLRRRAMEAEGRMSRNEMMAQEPSESASQRPTLPQDPKEAAREAKRLAALKALQALEWLNEDADPLYLWGTGANESDDGSSVAGADRSGGRSAAAKAAGFLGFRRGATMSANANGRGAGSELSRESTQELPKALGGGPTTDEYFDIDSTFPRVEGDDLMPGHRRLQPGRIPYTVFRSATLLLSFLWIMGVLLPFGLFSGILELEGIYTVPEQIGGELVDGPKGPISEDAAIAEEMERLHMSSIPSMPPGEPVQVSWPSHSGFRPRALSCDTDCRQLVVSDDFGVYAAVLKASTGEWIEDGRRLQLRGASSAPAERAAEDVVNQQALAANFVRVPPCPALEGQQLRDLGVVCTEGGGRQLCRVLVLHSRGRSLTECPFFNLAGERGATSGGAIFQDDLNAMSPSSIDGVTWKITGGWLHRKGESVESVAVNEECLHSELGAEGGSQSAFMPDRVGCVVVGTTSGRVVQMRRHLTNTRSLVPERAVQQRSGAVTSGSLHVVKGGFVMALRPSHNTLQALDAVTGSLIGEWRLPRGTSWRTVCGGSDSFYILGYSEDDEDLRAPKIWRFPVPAELRSRQAGSGMPLLPIGREAEM
eukprot:TRINITY_DN18332_c0_g1_i2.p1 TRINITY_DN18332_c0_g1~~TRINITY_DN18332_c0_g1_i2.p1  ORF type:complete len:1248 (-),score=283.09 TRINITY_DN18332_c0_g1_i2:172-3867(-)